jgi:hypothetical protein
MINNEDKLYILNLKLDFWKVRLQESLGVVDMLNEIGNQVKIDSNRLDIDKYSRIIKALELEKEALTN